MAELVDVNKGDLLEPLNKGKRKKKSFLHVFFQFFLVFVFAIVLSVFGQSTYDFTRYKRFYVNGESMYPTLNKDIKIRENGNDVQDIGKTYLVGSFSLKSHSYLCDYGLMDSSSSFKNDIKRFSIVVTYYNSDLNESSAKDGAELKIKRVIGMPGESLYFDSEGLLYIKGKGENAFSLVNQDFYNISSWNDESKEFLSNVVKQTNIGSNYANGEENLITLGNDEYFLVGDNRIEGCSNDSRSIGPVNEKCFVGRVVTIIGKCWFSIDDNGKNQESIDLTTLIMPWRLEML